MTNHKAIALLIDPKNRQITTVLVGDNNTIGSLVEGHIEAATIFPNGDVLYVNDEFLLMNPEHFFNIDTRGGYPLGGFGVLVGRELIDPDNGDFLGVANVSTTIEELATRITWCTKDEVEAWARANASDMFAGFTDITTGETTVFQTVGEFFGVGPKHDPKKQ